MGVIGVILLVAFVIICILLVSIVLIQKDEGGGLGGLFGGGGSSAFGARSQTVVTKTTYVFVTLFFLTTFGLAILNRAPVIQSLDEAAQQVQGITNEDEGQDWLDGESVSEEVVPTELNVADPIEEEN